MTITEYAERILFAETLEEKLEILPLADLTEDGIGEIPSLVVEPGRPLDLRMRQKGETGKTQLPSRPQLIDEESRGVLFHFFGNHELMAAELMALALLRFPDAPRAFRRGLLQTLREEQRHTLWYVKRMEACGVEFGSHPLSRFFWDAVATMETPLDYVTRLSLTFEQANLDYARHYSGIMREAGDEQSGALMERIYRDEISHVGYGLKWFRKWKREGQSDWEAYRDSLVFPLSPSRAKGNRSEFNREGRLEAGLGEDFVRELAVFERSKGRTPDVYWFNADAEAAMARGLDGGDYEPKRSVSEFVADLETLAIYLARRDDVVLVRKQPGREFLEMVRSWGFDLPEFEVVASDSGLAPDSLTARRRLRNLRPWSWEPRAATLMQSLRSGLPVGAGAPEWTGEIRRLFSKVEQAKRFGRWSEELPIYSHPTGDAGETGSICDRIHEAWEGEVPIVWKPEYAAAGRGFWLVEGAGCDLATGFDGGPKRVERGDSGVMEPWVDRVFDFSAQFEMEACGLRRIGFTRQCIGAGGRYAGTVFSPKFCRGLDAELARFLMRQCLPRYELEAPMMIELAQWLDEAGYRGPVGVDAFIYRDRRGELAHRVICEVNPRFTMGRLALDLSRRVAAGHALRLRIGRVRPEFQEWESVELDRHGKISAGRVVLTDAGSASAWAATLEVARDVSDLS
ncbi:MAG: DUF455 family protein [Verrucomicrobiae bacterium]|nr:DUF455 family protein [Verrucomicrobiae bacterium]